MWRFASARYFGRLAGSWAARSRVHPLPGRDVEFLQKHVNTYVACLNTLVLYVLTKKNRPRGGYKELLTEGTCKKYRYVVFWQVKFCYVLNCRQFTSWTDSIYGATCHHHKNPTACHCQNLLSAIDPSKLGAVITMRDIFFCCTTAAGFFLLCKSA
jgi:hypothetical protein